MSQTIKWTKEAAEQNKLRLDSLTAENRNYLTVFGQTLSKESAYLAKKPGDTFYYIFDEIYQAQQRGEKAEAYFGCSAAELASSMAKELPDQHVWLPILGSTVGNFILYLITGSIIWWSTGNRRWENFWPYVLTVAVSTAVYGLSDIWVNKLLIEKSKQTRDRARWVVRLVIFLLVVLAYYAIFRNWRG